jgi:hypothetical protein
MSDAQAVAILRDLARRYCAVTVTFADCGCCAVELFADGTKVLEEDRDLLTAARNAERAAGIEIPAERLSILDTK